MRTPADSQQLTTDLARRILEAEQAIRDRPAGLSFDAKCDLIAASNRLWDEVDAAGLRSAVLTRIALVGPALLRVAS